MQMQDFSSHYRAKSDEELLQLAKDLEQLSPEARFALNGELARRRLGIAEDRQEEQQSDSIGQEPDKPEEFAPSQSISSFMNQVALTYQTHFWGFVKLAFPGVLIGYVVTLIARVEVREIVSNIRASVLTRHTWQFIEIGLLNLTAAFLSWVSSCISVGAISFATREAAEHRPFPSFSATFSNACGRIGPLFRLAVVLFAAALVGVAALALFWGLVMFFAIRHRASQFEVLALRAIPYVLVGVGMLVFSRLWVAIPAFVLDHCGVGESLFRSDEKTEGKWLKLAALVAKSLVAGYIAALLPFWLAAWVTASVPQPWWLGWALDVLSVAGVSAVEPLLFIGFSLIYLQGATALTPEAASRQSRWAGTSGT